MNCLRRVDAAPSDPPGNTGRDACLVLLATVLAHPPGGTRGTALFLLDCCGPQLDDTVFAEVERRLHAAAPAWHRLLRGGKGEFVVIAQGLVDGGAVLTAAARLVHAFDDALQNSDLPLCPDVAIGISFAAKHTAHAEAMLAAAESGLRESRAATRLGRHTMLPQNPPSDLPD
jgi:predicted signal transduction protein with EAL and GGDEF domain